MIPDHQKQSFIDDLFPTFCIVLLKKGDDFDISGNAVTIGSNIAITATHVLSNNKMKSFADLDVTKKDETFYPDESLNILIYSVKYKKGFMLKVLRVVMVSGTDISILYLEDPTDTVPNDAWNDITLSVTPPNIDDHVFTIGSLLEPGGHAIKEGSIYIGPKYVGSFGIVTNFMEKHFQYSGPGFYATLTSFNTQSGSPVYNKEKELVGIISGGPNDDTTYVSVLYPLFASSFMIEDKEAFHLYDTAQKGAINCRDLSCIKIVEGEASITLPRNLMS